MKLIRQACILLAVLSLCSPIFALSPYGGYTEVKGQKTGFFHVHNIDGRWWCIDPAGYTFYAVGTDHVTYDGHWCESLGYAPYAKSVRERYHNDESAWAKSTTDRLKSWGFNMLGAGHSASTRGRGLAYEEFLGMGSEYASKEAIVERTTWTGFPDVFSPGFVEYCQKAAKDACAPKKDDPWLFGWFIDNELEWYGKKHSETGLAEETIALPATSHAKKALIGMLKQRYGSIHDLNQAWGTLFTSWDSAEKSTGWNEGSGPRIIEDKKAFVRLCADRYFSVTTNAIRHADPNHMILGCRFACEAPEIIDIAGKYLDIFTINYYGSVDLNTLKPVQLVQDMASYYRASKRPLMVTEWSFPAVNSGLPCLYGAGMRVATQADKARAFEAYQTAFFDMPFFVGSDYFMWVDEPRQGIAKTFPEDSNYGLVDGADNPWPLFTKTAARVNAKAYHIHSGRTSDLRIDGVKATKGGGLDITISNVGITDCTSSLRVRVDGKEYSKPFSLLHGGRTASHFSCKIPPGGHCVKAIVDPEGKLDEVHRGNNRIEEIVFNPGISPKKGVAVCVADGDAIISIPISKLGITSDRTLKNLRLVAQDGAECYSEIYDFDNSGSITPSDDLVFAAKTKNGTCSTYFLQTNPSKGNAAKLIRPTTVDHIDLDTGLIRLLKGRESSAVMDSVRLGSMEMGSSRLQLCQNGAEEAKAVPAERVDKILEWSGKLMRQYQLALSHKRDDTDGSYSYKAVYRLSAQMEKDEFTSKLLSISNTDSRRWKLASYSHCQQPMIGGSQSDDRYAWGTYRYAIWYDTVLGGCRGIVSKPSDGYIFDAIPDKSGKVYSFAKKPVNVMLKPGETYYDQGDPIVMFLTADKNPYDSFSRVMKSQSGWPRWQVFRR